MSRNRAETIALNLAAAGTFAMALVSLLGSIEGVTAEGVSVKQDGVITNFIFFGLFTFLGGIAAHESLTAKK